MKRFIIILLCSIGTAGCIPPGGGNPGGGTRIKGKLIRVTCASKVIQILDEQYYSLGETWNDGGTPATTYEHVARLRNPCEFPNNISAGSEFYFKLNPNQGTDCVVCAMWDNPPTKEIAITVVP